MEELYADPLAVFIDMWSEITRDYESSIIINFTTKY